MSIRNTFWHVVFCVVSVHIIICLLYAIGLSALGIAVPLTILSWLAVWKIAKFSRGKPIKEYLYNYEQPTTLWRG